MWTGYNVRKAENNSEGFFSVEKVCPTWVNESEAEKPISSTDYPSKSLCYEPNEQHNLFYVMPLPNWYRQYLKGQHSGKGKERFIELLNEMIVITDGELKLNSEKNENRSDNDGNNGIAEKNKDKVPKWLLYPKNPHHHLQTLSQDPFKFLYVINHPDQFSHFDIASLQWMKRPDWCPEMEPCYWPTICNCQLRTYGRTGISKSGGGFFRRTYGAIFWIIIAIIVLTLLMFIIFLMR